MTRGNATESRGRTTPVLLAAGAGSRFRDVGHKLTAELPEDRDRPAETVVHRALAAMLAADLGRAIVVTGRLTAPDLEIAPGDALDLVHNPHWATGQMSSLRLALDTAAAAGADIAVVGLADQPGIRPSAWRAVAQAATGGASIAVATYDGRRANPVALRRDVWALLESSGDHGARSLMRLRPDLVVEVPCTGSPMDIDTVEDLTRWQSN